VHGSRAIVLLETILSDTVECDGGTRAFKAGSSDSPSTAGAAPARYAVLNPNHASCNHMFNSAEIWCSVFVDKYRGSLSRGWTAQRRSIWHKVSSEPSNRGGAPLN
jgi:hypothetical protein